MPHSPAFKAGEFPFLKRARRHKIICSHAATLRATNFAVLLRDYKTAPTWLVWNNSGNWRSVTNAPLYFSFSALLLIIILTKEFMAVHATSNAG
jgi:hypothetical protein